MPQNTLIRGRQKKTKSTAAKVDAFVNPKNAVMNKVFAEDKPVHEWYRFVLSFPPHLVRQYVESFAAKEGMTALDPFCGTGTMLVECKKFGIQTIGLEANPIAHFATSVKLDWTPPPARLRALSEQIAASYGKRVRRVQTRTLPEEKMKLLLKNSISPLPLHKTLVLLEEIRAHEDPALTPHLQLALARALVTGIGNLHFGPEVGVSLPKDDAPVVELWLQNVQTMADDLQAYRIRSAVPSSVHLADAREPQQVIAPNSVDLVITSPPYPNEKDYTRTTRLESVILGLVNTKEELRMVKRGLVRSNTRGVYKGDSDVEWVEKYPEIQTIADRIERKRISMQKTSGFERMYHKVVKLYFGGMAKHLAAMRQILKPGAHLAYVVGDQASYLRVMIRTGELLAMIAKDLGYEVERIDLFRTRLATATGEQLREEVLILRWPG